MTSLCVITARGGSKRIPRKNIKDFLGKPIIAYSIEAALQSRIFDEVMVSTDDDEIATIARQYGAAVPFMRDEETSDDYATTADVLKEVLGEYIAHDQAFDVLCCLYPTAPFVTAEKLQKGFSLLGDKASCVLPVVPFSFPPQRAMEIHDGQLKYVDSSSAGCRSQDLSTLYHDAGQFAFYKLDAGYLPENFVFKGMIVPETEVQDIDNPSDWALAEMKYRMLKGEY